MTRREKIEELRNAYGAIGEAICSLSQAGMRGTALNLRREREDIMDEIDRLEGDEL
jgi:hypothetical protein